MKEISLPKIFLQVFSVVFILALFLVVAPFSWAVWNGNLYLPGSTLNPECLPGESNCSVKPPVAIDTSSGSSCTDGQIAKYVASSGEWVCSDDAGGLSYTASSGLSLSGSAFSIDLSNANTWLGMQTFGNGFIVGGDTITDLTGTGLAINSGTLATTLGSSIESAEITNGTILAEDIADGTLTLAKLNQNSCASGEIIKWNGSAWTCSQDDNDTYTIGPGLNLSSSLLSLDIDGLISGSTINNIDTLVIYDDSVGALRKITRANFLSGITGALVYQGSWNADSNFPSLTDASGTQGHYYVVNTSGSQDLGSGSITYTIGDWVIHNGSNWEKLDSTNDVQSVFGRTGDVTASAGDYEASEIDYIAGGNISATNVQDAVGELDTEKLSKTLNSGLLFVGNSANAAAAVALSGDATIDNAGVLTIGADKVELSTDTIGDYVASLADSGDSIFAIGNSGSENADVTIALADDVLDFTKFKDSLVLDTATSITLGGNDLTLSISAAGIPKINRSSVGQWLNLNDGSDSIGVFNSAGDPETSIAANIGSLAIDSTNGKLYIKTTDTLNTGWSELAAATTGMLSLNGITAQNQTFAVGTSGTDFDIDSDGTVHTFNIPDASATNRGVITTGIQTIAGNKTYTGTMTIDDITGNSHLTLNSGANDLTLTTDSTAALMLHGSSNQIDFSGHLIPSTANTFDIGSATHPVRDLYVSNNSIKVGGVSLSNNAGTLTWAGGAIQATSGSSSFDTLTATNATITNLSFSGPISAPTTVNTINGLVINSGALSGVNGLTMASNIVLGANFLSGDGDDEGIFVDSNGRVGIGTNSPGLTLAIGDADTGINWVGDGKISFYTDSYARMTMNNTGKVGIGTDNPELTLAIGDSDTGINWLADGKFNFSTNGVDRMALDQNGNVGVGTSTPENLLNLYDTYNSGRGIVLQNPTSGHGTGEQHGILFSIGGDASGFLWNYENQALHFGTNNTERLTILGSGNVGVNVSDPGLTLAIGDSDTGINWASDGRISFYTDSYARMTMDNTGKVGIATDNPALTLAIGDSDTGINWASDGVLDFYTNGTAKMRVDDSGRVGIGTQNMLAHLSLIDDFYGAPLTMQNGMSENYWIFKVSDTNSFYLRNAASSGVYLTDGANNWSGTSDARLKKNVVSIDGSALDKVLALNPVTFNWINEGAPQGSQVGFIAQEVLEAGLDQVVSIPTDTENDYYGLQYAMFAPYLTKAIQEQQGLIIANAEKVDSLIADQDEKSTAFGDDQLESLTVLNKTNLSTLEVTGLVTFKSEVNFMGEALFNRVAQFIDNVTFKKNVTFEDEATFNKGIEIKDRVTGDIYCSYMENGENKIWKGNCSDLPAMEVSPSPSPSPVGEVETNESSQSAIISEAVKITLYKSDESIDLSELKGSLEIISDNIEITEGIYEATYSANLVMDVTGEHVDLTNQIIDLGYQEIDVFPAGETIINGDILLIVTN